MTEENKRIIDSINADNADNHIGIWHAIMAIYIIFATTVGTCFLVGMLMSKVAYASSSPVWQEISSNCYIDNETVSYDEDNNELFVIVRKEYAATDTETMRLIAKDIGLSHADREKISKIDHIEENRRYIVVGHDRNDYGIILYRPMYTVIYDKNNNILFSYSPNDEHQKTLLAESIDGIIYLRCTELLFNREENNLCLR